MYSGIKQYLFLVVDQETKGVLTTCSSPSIANAVSKGIMNSSPMTIYFVHMGTNHAINHYRNNINHNYKLVSINPTMDSESNVSHYVVKTKNGNFYDLEEFWPSDEWLEKRKLANARASSITELETHCERYLSRVKNFVSDEILLMSISKDIEIYENTGEYSPGIIEWAEINNTTAEAARHELKMMLDTTRITVMRVHAVWNKYVNHINKFKEVDSELGIKIQADLRFGEV